MRFLDVLHSPLYDYDYLLSGLKKEEQKGGMSVGRALWKGRLEALL